MQLIRFVHYTLFFCYNGSYLKLQMQEIQVSFIINPISTKLTQYFLSPSLISNSPLEYKKTSSVQKKTAIFHKWVYI